MHQEHPIDGGIGEGQLELIDEGGKPGPVGRPFHHPLHRRHEGEAAFRLLAKEPEVRRRVAHPEHAHAARVGKALANAAPDEAPGDDAEALGIEIAQVDDIDRHGNRVAWILFLRRFGRMEPIVNRLAGDVRGVPNEGNCADESGGPHARANPSVSLPQG